MQIKSALLILATASFVAAQDHMAQTQQTIQFPPAPPCVMKCVNETASSKEVGCNGIEDINCICNKPKFQADSLECIGKSSDEQCKHLSKNQTELAQAKSMFDHVCQMANGTNGGTNKTADNSTTMNPNDAKHGHSGAASMMHQIATGTIVFSALLTGAVTLL